MYPLDRVHIRLRACIHRGVFLMYFEYFQNRLRSRTRVTFVMFLIAWRFEESAPFSYTCRNYDEELCSGSAFACVYPALYICFAFLISEESAPFSYTYANCELKRRLAGCQVGVKSVSSLPRAKRCSRRLIWIVFARGSVHLFNLNNLNRRLGVETERSGVPYRESKPSAHRRRTARTTRQITGANSSEARAI